MAVKVTIRRKPLSGGKESLYLDFYPPITNPETGEVTRRQFLNRHIPSKSKDPVDKAYCKETLLWAEMYRQKRESELNKPEIYSELERAQVRKDSQGSQSFKDYFKKLANKRTGASWNVWEAVLIHFNDFHPGEIKFRDITEGLCNEFGDYLQFEAKARRGGEKLAVNTASGYFSKFRTVLRQAYKDRLIPFELSAMVRPLKTEETHRVTLTIDEVNSLVNAECGSPVLKQAAIFSVYTGLRFSDIQKLTWKELEEIAPGQWVMNFKQQKTKGVEVLPVSAEAVSLLGERRADNDQVFKDLKYSAYYNKILSKWIGMAGISKDVTFNSFRHTFATLQLTFGTDLYTVSKLLGHRDIKTTQIYAKIIDETKRAAADRISLKIDNWK
jgi:integrase